MAVNLFQPDRGKAFDDSQVVCGNTKSFTGVRRLRWSLLWWNWYRKALRIDIPAIAGIQDVSGRKFRNVICDRMVTGLSQPFKKDEFIKLFTISQFWLSRGRVLPLFVW